MKDMLMDFEAIHYSRLSEQFKQKYGLKTDSVEEHEAWQEFVEEEFSSIGNY